MLQNAGVLHILTWKCALRHCGVLFFDIWTWKSAPPLRCFVHFDLEMGLRAYFSISELQKVLLAWGVLRAWLAHTRTHRRSHKKTRHVLNVFLSSRCQARGCFLSAWFAVHSPIFSSRVAWLGNVLRATRSCAILRHPNFKKRSVAEVFLAFWLGNALGATSRAIFGHPNFKKWSKNEVVWTFSLENVLRATVSCHFWAS